MKRQLFFFLLLLSAVAEAQTEKGRGLLSGNVSFVVNKQSQSGYLSNRYVTVYNPAIYVGRGVFVKDNWLVGGGLGLNATFNSYKPESSTEIYNYSTSLRGYVRRYWAIDRFWVFLGGGLKGDYYHSHTKSVDQSPNESNSSNYSVQAFAEAGAMWPITNRLALEMSTQSEAFPLSFSGFNVGLALLTGAQKSGSLPTTDAYQTQAGRLVLGGSIGLTNSVTKSNSLPDISKASNTVFDFTPTVGKFVRKNKLIGVSIPFTISKSNIVGTGTITITSLGISPYLKSYLTEGQLRPFIKGDILFMNFWTKGVFQTDIDWKAQSYGAGVSMGLAYMLGERFIIEAELGRLGGTYIHDGTDNALWAINANATLLPNFTVNYVLN